MSNYNSILGAIVVLILGLGAPALLMWLFLFRDRYKQYKTLFISESDLKKYLMHSQYFNMKDLLGMYGITSRLKSIREVDRLECNEIFIEILKSKKLEVPEWLIK